MSTEPVGCEHANCGRNSHPDQKSIGHLDQRPRKIKLGHFVTAGGALAQSKKLKR